eukprot:4231358-Lingulodinium_polyedra.AAC.1
MAWPLTGRRQSNGPNGQRPTAPTESKPVWLRGPVAGSQSPYPNVLAFPAKTRKRNSPPSAGVQEVPAD